MPGFVRTKKDETKWSRAKGAAGEKGGETKWALANYIFHRMKSLGIDLEKCVVEKSSNTGMQQYSSVVFQTPGKIGEHELENEKLDFPSTGKALDLTRVIPPEFPSTPETGKPIAAAFGSPGRPNEKSWNGPDTQRKGSDFPNADVQEFAKKSFTMAGRRVKIVKGGDEGSRNGNLGGYPIDATEDVEKRRAFIANEKMKEKMKVHEDNKKYSGNSTFQISTGPDAYLGRSSKLILMKGKERIGEYTVTSPDKTKVYKRAPIDPNKPHGINLIHYSAEALRKKEERAKRKVSKGSALGQIIQQWYTQNQPLDASLKPLLGFLIKKDDKKKEETEKGMSSEEVHKKIRETTKKEGGPRIKPIKKPDLGPDGLPEDYQSHDPDFSKWATEFNAKKSHVNPIDGGIGDELEYKDVDQKELEAGIEVEQEHVGNDPNIDDGEKKVRGADIAMDHLKEDPNYYTHLQEMERSAKEENKSETQKKKLLAVDEATKSIPRQRKLEDTVASAEKMVGIREETGASPGELKTTRGQLKAYTAKLKAERRKNSGLVNAQTREERDPSSKAYKKLQRENKVKFHAEPKVYVKKEESND